MSEIINNEIIEFINTNFTNLLENNSIKSEKHRYITKVKNHGFMGNMPLTEIINYPIDNDDVKYYRYLTHITYWKK